MQAASYPNTAWHQLLGARLAGAPCEGRGLLCFVGEDDTQMEEKTVLAPLSSPKCAMCQPHLPWAPRKEMRRNRPRSASSKQRKLENSGPGRVCFILEDAGLQCMWPSPCSFFSFRQLCNSTGATGLSALVSCPVKTNRGQCPTEWKFP